MVVRDSMVVQGDPHFQYSLCRVVLMVTGRSGAEIDSAALSVLALSSRFDGQR